jgi:hypothetical protein
MHMYVRPSLDLHRTPVKLLKINHIACSSLRSRHPRLTEQRHLSGDRRIKIKAVICRIRIQKPGANPTIGNYNATGSLARFESKKIFSL